VDETLKKKKKKLLVLKRKSEYSNSENRKAFFPIQKLREVYSSIFTAGASP